MSDKKKLPRYKVILGAHGKANKAGEPGPETKLVRLSHLHAHEARLNTESGKEEFSVVAMIPKTNKEDVASIKDLIKRLQKEVWLDEGKKVPPAFWNPMRDGDEDTKQDGSPLPETYRGYYIINCKTDAEHPPGVVGTERDSKGKLTKLDRSEIKSGDWGRVGINLSAYTKGTGGVGAYLTNIQKVQAGDPLAGGSSAEDDFSAFEDETDAESAFD